jgi:hypothetical protein
VWHSIHHTKEPCQIELTVKRRRGLGATNQVVSLLAPHEVFSAVHAAGGQGWNKGVMGNDAGDTQNVADFWAHVADQQWCRLHPGLLAAPGCSQTVPIGLHGDDVADVKSGDKVLVMSWNSVVSHAPSILARFLICAIPYTLIVHGVTTHQMFQWLAWSMQSLLEGLWPMVDHLGRAFTEGYRAENAGKPLAAGWRGLFVQLRGDLLCLRQSFGWRCYAHDFLCHRCFASKKVDELSYFDCSQTAGWRRTLTSHEAYLINTPIDQRSPLFAIPGLRLETVLGDAMHGISLGMAQHACGNVLWELASEAPSNTTVQMQRLERLWVQFRHWCRQRGVETSQPRFTLGSLNKTKVTGTFPLFNGKAHNTRVVTAFLADLLCSQRADSLHARLVTMCIWALAAFYAAMDAAGDLLSDQEVEDLQSPALEFMATYSALARRSLDQGICAWQVVPKYHNTSHLIDDIRSLKINPKAYWCMCDEDFVGRISRIARVSHRTTLTRRALQRYIITLDQLHRRRDLGVWCLLL